MRSARTKNSNSSPFPTKGTAGSAKVRRYKKINAPAKATRYIRREFNGPPGHVQQHDALLAIRLPVKIVAVAKSSTGAVRRAKIKVIAIGWAKDIRCKTFGRKHGFGAINGYDRDSTGMSGLFR